MGQGVEKSVRALYNTYNRKRAVWCEQEGLPMKNDTRRLLVTLFTSIITTTVYQRGKGPLISMGAGVLGGVMFYLVSRYVLDKNL